MKKTLFSIFILTLLLISIGCEKQENQTTEQNTQAEETPTEKDYLLFSLNVHDWVFPEKSAETVLRVIELHEKYNIPVDIYVDDQAFQNYVENYPELIEKLKTSPVVSVSYHIRPPMPMYVGFSSVANLDELHGEELYDVLRSYEEHKLDLETGEIISDQPGGYVFVKDTIGYAPLAVGNVGENNEIDKTLAQIYVEEGAKLAVTHGKDTSLGETTNSGLYLRPEDVEIKWYEYMPKYSVGQVTAESIILQEVAEDTSASPLFINLKIHEDNFYTWGTPFLLVYWDSKNEKNPLEPPYDLSKGVSGTKMKTEDETASQWEWYEEALKYASEHPELYEPINNKDIVEMLE